ncbi:VanZ family protein [Daejeonella sp.]|uniref:VanZ family protein n=1 Tax=Daejeonella sp. TaxID=2805397 RepID=UPI003C75A2A0
MLATLRHQYLAILWAIFILIMFDIPMSDAGAFGVYMFAGFDKLVHTGCFFVLTVLLFYGKIRQQSSYTYRFVTILKILAITTALGVMTELLQLYVFTHRTADWWDLFADMVGVGMGIFSYIFLHRFRFNEKLL